jgi:hypothetical protein
MIELINTAVQTVQPLQAVVYNEVVYRSRRCAEGYRGDGGLVKLIPPGNADSVYRVTFNGNIAVPTGETVGEISVAIAADGEVLAGTTARITPAAVENYFNVALNTLVRVPCGCCTPVSVRNTSDIPILVDNPNIVVARIG